MRFVAGIIGVLSVAMFWAQAQEAHIPSSGQSVERSPSLEDYRLVYERNIFSRSRTSPSRKRIPTTTYSTPRIRESQIVLVGVTCQGSEMEAFFEDDRSGESFRIQAGQSIKGGTVVSISLDGVEYKQGDGQRFVAVGETLTGGGASLGVTSGPTDSSSQAGSQPSGQSPENAGEAGDGDILERMRQRRMQELEK